MSDELVCTIRQNTEALFTNAEILLATCRLDAVLCDMPVWKHVYHMLHSLDQWFINPNAYTEPAFHEPGLNSLDIPGGRELSRAELGEYLASIERKLRDYLRPLDDESLYEIPAGCRSNRLGLILSQYRHFYAHLGNINGVTIQATNLWPRVVGITGECGASTEGLYE